MLESFLSQHEAGPALLLALVFTLALTESLVVIGLLIPGIAGLVALTLLAAAEPVAPLWWWLAGACGALCGDGLSFHIGRFSRNGLHHWRIFRRHPQWLERGHHFFTRYGVMSIAIGRFIGPLRPLVPAVAGACDMPRRQFWWVNLLSSAAWSAAYLLPVYWFGREALERVPLWLLLSALGAATLLASTVSWLINRYR